MRVSEAPIKQQPGVAPALAAVRAEPSGWRRVGAAVALVEGLLMVGNGIAVAVLVGRDGITGPEAVASPAGVVIEVALYLLFGIALLWMARGFVRGSVAVLTPFMLAQVLGLTVSVPLAMGGGAVGLAGALVVAACLSGLLAWAMVVRHNLRSGVQ